MNWSVGHNLPGYIPESDPVITSEWEDAVITFINELERVRDDEFISDDDADDCQRAIEQVQAMDPAAYLFYVGEPLIAYWINETDQPPTDDDD